MNSFLNFWLPTLIFTIVSAAIVVVSTILTKGKSRETKMLPIKIIWIVLVVFEVLKITHMIASNKIDGVITPAFVPNRYPFVFCSLCMYTYPLFMFKKNKLSDSAMAFSVIPFLFTFLATLITNANYDLSFWHAHSYGFHFMMGAVAIYLITSGLYKFKLKDWFGIFVWFGGYIVLSVFISLFIGADLSIFGPGSGFLGFLYGEGTFSYATGNLLLILVIGMLLFGIYGLIHIIGKHRPVKLEKEKRTDA